MRELPLRLEKLIIKDHLHETNIIASGAVFYPLSVQSFGTWSTHSLEILKSIVRKTLLLQSLTISKAVPNLLQQLSIRL